MNHKHKNLNYTGIVLITLILIVAILPITPALKLKQQPRPLTLSSWLYEPTIIVPDNYSTIQEAVNASTPGDCIGVRNGIYIESLILHNKTDLILCGELNATTKIIGNTSLSDTTISCKESRNIIITNFLISGFHQDNYSGIIKDDGINITIAKSIITENINGIHIKGKSRDFNISNNTISNNTFVKSATSNSGYGVLIEPSIVSEGFQNIEKNLITRNDIGVASLGHNVQPGLLNVWIEQNTIINNFNTSIEITYTICDIGDNTISESEYGIVASSSNLIVTRNDVIGNGVSFKVNDTIFFFFENNIAGDGSPQLIMRQNSFGLAPINWWGTATWPRPLVEPRRAPVLLFPWNPIPIERT